MRHARPERLSSPACRSRRFFPAKASCSKAASASQRASSCSNADPRRTLRLLGLAADADWRAQVERVPIEGCTVKLNVHLRELPNFTARPGVDEPHHYGQINAPLTKEEWKAGYAAARRGELPEHLWCELYFQSAHDPSIVPPGQHTMSVFAQYVPYKFAHGTWDERREEVRALAMKSLARFCSKSIPKRVIDAQVLGPPDIEQKVGLTGGHIFQGECLPPYMWANRLSARTPMQGVYLCGACTHPGGSVIGINGRNAAMAVLRTKDVKNSAKFSLLVPRGSAMLRPTWPTIPRSSEASGFATWCCSTSWLC